MQRVLSLARYVHKFRHVTFGKSEGWHRNLSVYSNGMFGLSPKLLVYQ
jgi:hypothetical protein